MKTHFFKVINRRAAAVTTTLCGRMSRASRDGINSTSDRAKVTCRFCLARLVAQEQALPREVRLRNNIVHQAGQCEEALRLAAFADREASLGGGMATSLRKLAEYHSYHAFSMAEALSRITP